MWDIEDRIQRTGMKLYDLIEEEKPSFLSKDYWLNWIMEKCMSDSSFKVNTFRFVDVCPYLNTSESMIKHIKEYFNIPLIKLPMVSTIVRNSIEKAAKSFIVGADPGGAIPALKQLTDEGALFTADLLGEAVMSEPEADEYMERYIDLLDKLDGQFSDISISVKPSAMYSQMNNVAFDYSVDKAKERLRPIFRKAMSIGAHICLDMEHYDLRELTAAIYKSLLEEKEFNGYPKTGIVTQAYLRNCAEYTKDIVDWCNDKFGQRILIRLVKGAYWDAETVWARQRNWPVPVFTSKQETDQMFERMVIYLLGCSDKITLACASHNIRSIAYVIEMAKIFGTKSLEYQILYGMAKQVKNALLKAGLPIRVYFPIGEMIPGMAYLVRRLLENTSNESFLRKSFVERVPKEMLLRG